MGREIMFESALTESKTRDVYLVVEVMESMNW